MIALSVIIPLYNEEGQLPLTLATLLPILREKEPQFELLLIDDGSKDCTWAAIQEAHRLDSRVKGLRFSRNFGKEAALCAGLDAAKGEAVLIMDGDLQHPPSYIPEFLRLHREGWQIVEGRKSARGKESAIHRWFVTRFYRLFQQTTSVNLENASDFKLLDRSVVEAWKSLQERTTFFRGMVSWLGFKKTTVIFEVAPRQIGESKWSFFQLLKLALNALTSFSAKPLQIVTWLGIFSLIGGLVLAIQTFVHFLSGTSLGGFTTVILLQLIIGGMIMLSLGIIGTYIGLIYEEIKGRPRYLIGESTDTSICKSVGESTDASIGRNFGESFGENVSENTNETPE